MKKLKLINLSKDVVLPNSSMERIKGGGPCCCGCCTSGNSANYYANQGAGYTCSCGNTMYGSH